MESCDAATWNCFSCVKQIGCKYCPGTGSCVVDNLLNECYGPEPLRHAADCYEDAETVPLWSVFLSLIIFLLCIVCCIKLLCAFTRTQTHTETDDEGALECGGRPKQSDMSSARTMAAAAQPLPLYVLQPPPPPPASNTPPYGPPPPYGAAPYGPPPYGAPAYGPPPYGPPPPYNGAPYAPQNAVGTAAGADSTESGQENGVDAANMLSPRAQVIGKEAIEKVREDLEEERRRNKELKDQVEVLNRVVRATEIVSTSPAARQRENELEISPNAQFHTPNSPH